ncbi:MAG TPA: alpha/beta hydrolase, partial [Patescibacteria group bacterium]
GTEIGYRQFGKGPGLVLIQGMMGTAQNFVQLAEILAKNFTVYTPDRRGRGISGPTNKNYSIKKEIEDLEAVLKKTNTHSVFGLSAGAIVSLQAALELSTIHKLAIYEPPLFNKPNDQTALMEDYKKEITRDNVAAALVIGMKAGKFGPSFILSIPNRILEFMVNMGIKQEEKKGSGEYEPMKKLAYTLYNDFRIVVEMVGKAKNFATIKIPTLLLGGSKSQDYFKSALNTLETILPNATRIEFPGVDHSTAWNSDRGGKPEVVAQTLKTFFLK